MQLLSQSKTKNFIMHSISLRSFESQLISEKRKWPHISYTTKHGIWFH